MEPPDYRLDWMAASINTLLNISDLPYCRKILQGHRYELLRFMGTGTDEVNDQSANRIFFIWKAVQTEVLDEIELVLEPGKFFFKNIRA